MRLYLVLLLPLLLGATPLKVLIHHAKESHLSLEAMKQKILAIEYKYKVTKKFSDPVISLGLSDIQFQNPTNRALEPMQYSSINFKQTVPFFGKRAANGEKVLAQKKMADMSLEQVTVRLVKDIKITSYQVWQAEQLLKVIMQYSDLTKEDIKLYSAYGSSESNAHIQMINAKLFLLELQIKQSNLTTTIKDLYEKLSYLSNMPTLHVRVTMGVNAPKPLSFYLRKLPSNKAYKLKKAALEEADADIKVKKLAFYPNPFIQVGYYHRQKFRDYAGVTVGFSLPIYGTQKLNEQRSEAIALSKESDVANYKNDLISRIQQVYVKLQNSYQVCQILTKQSIPQVKNLQQVSASYLQNGTPLFVYIDTLKKQFEIDERKIIAIGSYHTHLATLDALIGSQK